MCKRDRGLLVVPQRCMNVSRSRKCHDDHAKDGAPVWTSVTSDSGGGAVGGWCSWWMNAVISVDGYLFC